MGTSWLLASCMEARGKQDLWIKQKPEVLLVLREQAIIQSAESSNRIEGVTVSPERLRPVVIGRAKPRDRSEEELAGYRRALDWIFLRKRAVPVPDVNDIIVMQTAIIGEADVLCTKDDDFFEKPASEYLMKMGIAILDDISLIHRLRA